MYRPVSDYFDNHSLRESFERLANEIFNIEFDDWIGKGFHSGKYIPYSYENNGEIVSNASVNVMNILVKGRRFNAVQIGTVMTNESFRKQGLATKLLGRILEEYSDKADIIYLFPNENEMKFYENLGFELNRFRFYSADITKLRTRESRIRKLDIYNPDDLETIKRIIKNQTNYSDIFDVSENFSVRMWHYMYTMKNFIFHIPEIDAVASFSSDEGYLSLMDLVSTYDVGIKEAIEYIKRENNVKCKIMFTPHSKDFTELNIESAEGNLYFSKSGKLRIGKEFSFPLTSQA